MVKMNCLKHRRTRIPATTLSRNLVIKQRPSSSVKRKQKVGEEKDQLFCRSNGLSGFVPNDRRNPGSRCLRLGPNMPKYLDGSGICRENYR